MITSWSKTSRNRVRRNFLGKKVKESKKKKKKACKGRRKHMLESNGDDVEVVTVSSCFCVMLCSLAFAVRVTVVSSCESAFVCRPCEPQRFISQTEESTHAVKSTRQPLAVTTALPPCLAEEYRCAVFFFGRTGLSPIPWWVDKTGVGLCAVEKDGFYNKTEQPKLMYEERRFYQVGMVVSPPRCALKGQLARRPEVLVSSVILFGGIEECNGVSLYKELKRDWMF